MGGTDLENVVRVRSQLYDPVVDIDSRVDALAVYQQVVAVQLAGECLWWRPAHDYFSTSNGAKRRFARYNVTQVACQCDNCAARSFTLAGRRTYGYFICGIRHKIGYNTN